MIVSSEIVARGALRRELVDAMFSVLDSCFEGHEREVFNQDLAESQFTVRQLEKGL